MLASVTHMPCDLGSIAIPCCISFFIFNIRMIVLPLVVTKIGLCLLSPGMVIRAVGKISRFSPFPVHILSMWLILAMHELWAEVLCVTARLEHLAAGGRTPVCLISFCHGAGCWALLPQSWECGWQCRDPAIQQWQCRRARNHPLMILVYY